MKRISAIILCLCMALTVFTGCSTKKPVISVDGTQVTNGLYLYYQMQAWSEAGKQAPNDGTPILKSTVNGIPASEWIQNKTIELCQTHIYIEKSCDTEGLALTEEAKKTVDSETANTWEKFGEQFEVNGITKADYLNAMLNMKKSDLIFEKLYADMQKEVTDEEVMEYLDSQIVTIESIIVPFSDDKGVLADEKTITEHKKFAQEILDAIKDGASLASYANKMPDMYRAVGVSEENILPSEEYFTKQPVNYIPSFEFGDFILDTEIDGFAMYADDYKAIVFKRVANYSSAADLEFYKIMLPTIRKQTEYKAVLSEQAQKLEYTFNAEAAKVIGPQNIVPISLPTL